MTGRRVGKARHLISIRTERTGYVVRPAKVVENVRGLRREIEPVSSRISL